MGDERRALEPTYCVVSETEQAAQAATKPGRPRGVALCRRAEEAGTTQKSNDIHSGDNNPTDAVSNNMYGVEGRLNGIVAWPCEAVALVLSALIFAIMILVTCVLRD